MRIYHSLTRFCKIGRTVENLILNSSREGELVLDCFAGSGTTAHACKKHNRRFVGFELDEEYYKMAQKRLENEVQGVLLV